MRILKDVKRTIRAKVVEARFNREVDRHVIAGGGTLNLRVLDGPNRGSYCLSRMTDEEKERIDGIMADPGCSRTEMRLTVISGRHREVATLIIRDPE